MSTEHAQFSVAHLDADAFYVSIELCRHPELRGKPVVVAGSGPRAGSKTARLIGMLKRPGGASLEEITSTFGWQIHTTRALMSAGGSLTRKHGLTAFDLVCAQSNTRLQVDRPGLSENSLAGILGQQ